MKLNEITGWVMCKDLYFGCKKLLSIIDIFGTITNQPSKVALNLEVVE